MPKILGVDLGTANTFIYMKGKGIILRTPSVVAIDRDTRDVVAVGRAARRMLGKTPEGILAYRPLKNGVIADFDVTAKMIRTFFEMTETISFFSRPVVIACIPYGVTEVEKRAVEDVLFEAGARSVALIEEPLAAAIGTGLKVGGPRGSMIVDIGGGTTEVAVMSLGGIVASRSVRTAGDALNEAIVNYLRSEKSILIGDVTAEHLKISIGSAHPSADVQGRFEEVFGRELRTGHASSAIITSADTREAMSDELQEIIRAIKTTLEDTPPELSSDIYDNGITITGGGAHLRGIGTLIRAKTGIRVNLAPNPFESVCKGIGRVIESEKMRGDILKYRGK
ncbi:MAG: rod shape-determining protein [Clostridia bacterium]|nr:rod shape-determining protein [Clostridia bacterium]